MQGRALPTLRLDEPAGATSTPTCSKRRPQSCICAPGTSSASSRLYEALHREAISYTTRPVRQGTPTDHPYHVAPIPHSIQVLAQMRRSGEPSPPSNAETVSVVALEARCIWLDAQFGKNRKLNVGPRTT
jgi:hypothetical protein